MSVQVTPRILTSHRPDRERPTICHLLHTMNVGGAELLARDYAKQATSDFRCVFACLDELGTMGQELRDAGHVVEVLGRRPGFDPRCVWRLAGFLKRQQVRLVHAHQYAPFFYAGLARGVFRTIPIMFTEHGRDYPDFRRPKRVLANRMLLKRCDRVVAVGQAVKEALVAHEGLPADRVNVIYNGIDLAAYERRPADRQQARNQLGLVEGQIAVMQVARLNRLKDHATALRAMAVVAKRQSHVRLFLIGDGEERKLIETLVEQLGLQSQVRLLGERKDVAWLLQASDLFLLTSITEGIPLTLIEAMAMGIPCVATEVGGVPEVIEHGRSGLIAPPTNPNSVADCVCQLATDDMLRESLGAAGRARALDRFNAASMHGAYGREYRNMIGFTTNTQAS